DVGKVRLEIVLGRLGRVDLVLRTEPRHHEGDLALAAEQLAHILGERQSLIFIGGGRDVILPGGRRRVAVYRDHRDTAVTRLLDHRNYRRGIIRGDADPIEVTDQHVLE